MCMGAMKKKEYTKFVSSIKKRSLIKVKRENPLL